MHTHSQAHMHATYAFSHSIFSFFFLLFLYLAFTLFLFLYALPPFIGSHPFSRSLVLKVPSFPVLEEKIKKAIKALGGEVFPKLNWSAPQVITH